MPPTDFFISDDRSCNSTGILTNKEYDGPIHHSIFMILDFHNHIFPEKIAQRVIDQAVQIFGGLGVTKGNPAERF